MNRKLLYTLWGVLFIVCAALGFIPEAGGALGLIMTALAIVHFLPPAALLYLAKQEKDRNTAALIRNLSALSLGVTLITLILNLVLAVSSETLGNILHCVLAVVSSPMLCSGYWALSLFLWACLLMAGISLSRKA